MQPLPELREYQREGIDDIRAAARELARMPRTALGYGILAVAPTGAGKTRMGLELATSAIAKGGRALWLAPRNELVEQPVRRLEAYGYNNIRTIYDGTDTGSPDAPLIVASIQTLVARNMTPPADVVILDEARHYVADQWGRIAGAYLDSVRAGLDATPARADGKSHRALFDRIVPISSIAELTALGFLVPSRIIGPAKYDKTLAAAPVEAYLEDAKGKRSLVFCTSKREARRQAKLFLEAGIPAEAVDADSTMEERRDALDRVRSGETKVLVNCLLFTEGLDLVELESIIIARGVSHPSTWLQIGGRGLRPAPHIGKTECVISDLRGHFHRRGFGPLDDPRTWHLDGQPIRTQERLPCVVQCRACHGWFRGGARCHCGAALPAPPPPKISKRKRAELRRARALANRRGPRWEAYRRLVLEQRAAGHKPQSVFFRFRARFGYPPPWRPTDVEDACQATQQTI